MSVFGGYDLQVMQLSPTLIHATEDTILWNIPKLDKGHGWSLHSGAFSGWAQASNFIKHNEGINITSQTAVELDTRTCYAWGATFGHELHAAPLGLPTSS